MDEFLSDIYTIVFQQWILHQHEENCQIDLDEKRPHVIIIKTDYSYSEITFNPMNIIELSVTNTFTQQIEFYLHFQMKTIKHALDLYQEMLECIKQLINKPTIKILLCCSGGLTTGFFAQKLNDAIQLLDLAQDVSAVPYSQLFDIGQDYDIILLAPQISYMQAKVQEILKEKIVAKIPALIFAKYDVKNMLNYIHQFSQTKKENDSIIEKTLSLKHIAHHDSPILCLSLIRNSNRIHILYRLYDQDNTILLDKKIIKYYMKIEDLFDVIDTVLLQYKHIHIIGIALPGIMNHGYITSMNVNGLENMNFEKAFQNRYQQQFIFTNDVNAVAVGYYTSQKKYDNLSFLFQPISYYAGVGHIVNGQLIYGRSHLAGEVQYLPLQLSNDKLVLNKTPEGAIELIAQYIVSIMVSFDPQAIIICCALITDITELKKEISHYIPKQYIPDIIKVEDMQEYILLGQLIECIKKLR